MEPFVLTAIGAIVVTLVRGRWRLAIVVAAVGIGLVVALAVTARGAGEEDLTIAQGAWLAAFLLWSVLALVAATRPPTPHSQWARGRAHDPAGIPMKATQPTRRRVMRAFLGAIAGTTPAIALIGVVLLVADTGDETQIAFVGVPLGLLGLGLGAWLGFNWVRRSESRRVATQRESGEPLAD